MNSSLFWCCSNFCGILAISQTYHFVSLSWRLSFIPVYHWWWLCWSNFYVWVLSSMADVFKEVVTCLPWTWWLSFLHWTPLQCHFAMLRFFYGWFSCHNYCSDFTISFTLLSYSTCLEASCAPSFVRVVLSVSRACFRYVRVYLLCAELKYWHGDDSMLWWH